MRIELTINDAASLPAMTGLLRRSGIRSVNVTDTSRQIDPVEISRRLLDADPTLDVMTHVAAKHHDEVSFMNRVEHAAENGIRKILIVSGHPRGRFDSLAALDAAEAAGLDIDVYCVYNPFLEDDALRVEDDRLGRKLGHGMVRGICLQIGMDLAAIARGAMRIRSHRFDAEVLGSIAVPTAAMLERFKTKPLFGVTLPDRYLASVGDAESMTREILADLDTHDIEPLLFFAGLDEAALASGLAYFKQ